MHTDILDLDPKKFNQYLKSQKTVLIYFYLEGCGSCEQQSKILNACKDDLCKIYPDLVIVKINSEKDNGIHGKYDIDSFPAFILWYKQDFMPLQNGVLDFEFIKNNVRDCMEEIDES
jgi:thioredoxin-like negative regulator of GroEL